MKDGAIEEETEQAAGGMSIWTAGTPRKLAL